MHERKWKINFFFKKSAKKQLHFVKKEECCKSSLKQFMQKKMCVLMQKKMFVLKQFIAFVKVLFWKWNKYWQKKMKMIIFFNEKKKLEIIAMNRLHAIMSFRKFMWKIVACGFYFLFYKIQSFVASEEKDLIWRTEIADFFCLARNGYEKQLVLPNLFLSDRFVNLEGSSPSRSFFLLLLKKLRSVFCWGNLKRRSGFLKDFKTSIFFVCFLLSSLCRIFDRRKRKMLDYKVLYSLW